jgi:hypothetical protein
VIFKYLKKKKNWNERVMGSLERVKETESTNERDLGVSRKKKKMKFLKIFWLWRGRDRFFFLISFFDKRYCIYILIIIG